MSADSTVSCFTRYGQKDSERANGVDPASRSQGSTPFIGLPGRPYSRAEFTGRIERWCLTQDCVRIVPPVVKFRAYLTAQYTSSSSSFRSDACPILVYRR